MNRNYLKEYVLSEARAIRQAMFIVEDELGLRDLYHARSELRREVREQDELAGKRQQTLDERLWYNPRYLVRDFGIEFKDPKTHKPVIRVLITVAKQTIDANWELVGEAVWTSKNGEVPGGDDPIICRVPIDRDRQRRYL